MSRIIGGLAKLRTGHLAGERMAGERDAALAQQQVEQQRAEQDRQRQIERDLIAKELAKFNLGEAKRRAAIPAPAQAPVEGTPEWEKWYRAKVGIDSEADIAEARARPPSVGQDPAIRAQNRAQQLRTQFNSDAVFKNSNVIAENYSRIQAAAKDPSAAGDLALIFSFMKMQDPGSTVREGEFANAQNAAGVPDQIRNAWNRALKGERLNPAQRADFVNQARAALEAQRGSLKGTIGRYTGIAERLGVDPQDVIYDPLAVHESAATVTPPPADPMQQIEAAAQRALQKGVDPAVVQRLRAQAIAELRGPGGGGASY